MGIASVLWLFKELMPQYEALFSPNKEMNTAPQYQTISTTFWSDLSPYATRFIGHLLAVGGQTTLTKGFLIIYLRNCQIWVLAWGILRLSLRT